MRLFMSTIQSAMNTAYTATANAASSLKDTVVNNKKEVAIGATALGTVVLAYVGYQNSEAITTATTDFFTSLGETITGLNPFGGADTCANGTLDDAQVCVCNEGFEMVNDLCQAIVKNA